MGNVFDYPTARGSKVATIHISMLQTEVNHFEVLTDQVMIQIQIEQVKYGGLIQART